MQRVFAKEAALLHEIKHENIVNVIGVCEKPAAIIMEFCEFSIKPFDSNRDEAFHSLDQFLEFFNLEELYKVFPTICNNIAVDIGRAVSFLHSNDMVHRDIKPANILISNQHYINLNYDSMCTAFKEKPIICKLGDLGEARSEVLQTKTMLSNVNRGTPAFMAPEIYSQGEGLHAATISDLKNVDNWALAMTIFCLLNPDQSFPYQKDFQKSRKDNLSLEADVFIEKCMEEQKLPDFSDSYLYSNACNHQRLRNFFYGHSLFEPNNRGKPCQLVAEMSYSTQIAFHCLAVSQNSAIEEFHSQLLLQGKCNGDSILDNAPINDGTNACSFLSLDIIDCFANRPDYILGDDLVNRTADIITKFPESFNKYRDVAKMPDVREAYLILKEHNLIQNTFDFTELLVNNFTIFSYNFQKEFNEKLSFYAGVAAQKKEPVFLVCHFDIYVFVIAACQNGQILVFDTHSIPEVVKGNKNGIIVCSDDVVQISEWLMKRFQAVHINPSVVPHMVFVEYDSSNNLIGEVQIDTINKLSKGDDGEQTTYPDNEPSNEEIEHATSKQEQVPILIVDEMSTENENDNNEITVTEAAGVENIICLSETESDENVPKDTNTSYFNGDSTLPIFQSSRKQPIQSLDALNVLSNITKSQLQHKLCTTVPVFVDKDVEFVVDTGKLLHWRDIQSDMVCGFERTGTKNLKYVYSDEFEKVGKNSIMHDVEVRRFVYNHKQHKDFHKVIIGLWKFGREDPEPLFYVQYYFDKSAHDINFEITHGNSKDKNNLAKQTNYSTKAKIKTLYQEGLKGKEIFSKMTKSVEGFENAKAPNTLPASLNQIYDLTRKMNSKSDEVLELIDMSQQQKQQGNRFLREVRTAPELSMLLANNRQLNDVYRFAAATKCSILGIDATFNICKYNVTITTYRHPLLQNKRDKVCPIILGPVLIHSHKTFESYYSLPSEMIRFYPTLANLKTFGSDGEKALYEAMRSCFPNAKHLLCWIHEKDNVEKKLSSLGIAKLEIKKYCDEIFGVRLGSTKVKGLLDASSENEFECKWKILEEKWKKRGIGGAQFLSYMNIYKKEEMKNCMIGEARTAAGLGDPPAEYTQNANECMNSIVKNGKTKKSSLTLKETVQLFQKEVNYQEERMKAALIGRGDWEIRPEFEDQLKVSEKEYCAMNVKQRQRLAKKIYDFVPHDVVIERLLTNPPNSEENESNLTMPPLGICDMPDSICEEIRSNAQKYVSNENWIVPDPAGSDIYQLRNEIKPSKPYVVKYDKLTKSFVCDNSFCLRYKSFKFCSHTVASSWKVGCFESYIHTLNNRGAKNFFRQAVEAQKGHDAGKKPTKATQVRKGPPNHIDVEAVNRATSNTSAQSNNTQSLTQQDCHFNITLNCEMQQIAKQPYLAVILRYCHHKVTTCYGCEENFRKFGEPISPSDLILVSKIYREYYDVKKGQMMKSKDLSNAYFHFNSVCLTRRNHQPPFDRSMVVIPDQTKSLLDSLHVIFLTQHRFLV